MEKQKVCKKCGKEFSPFTIIDGAKKPNPHRQYCFDCNPPDKKSTITCALCGKEFPKTEVIDGKKVFNHTRTHCFDCNPRGKRRIWGNKVAKENKYDYGKRPLVMKTFTCKTCGSEYTHKTRNLECSTCRHKKIREKNKQRSIDYLGKKCLVCGYDLCNEGLEFHHKNPYEKDFTMSEQWGSKKWEVLKEELDKCILLCSNHHREYHSGKFCFLFEKKRMIELEKKGYTEYQKRYRVREENP